MENNIYHQKQNECKKKCKKDFHENYKQLKQPNL